VFVLLNDWKILNFGLEALGMSCNGSRDEIDPRENGGIEEPGLEDTPGFDR